MSHTPVNGSPKHAGDSSRRSRSAKTDAHSMGSLGSSRDGSKGRSSNSSTPPPSIHPNQLEDKEELRLRELEEARARAAQMEKTMRWWSDCTANWREKWGKVRAERNKAREEVRQLRMKLEVIAKESTALKRDKQEVLVENERLRKALEHEQAKTSLQIQSPVTEDNPDYLPEKDTSSLRQTLPEGDGQDIDFIKSVMLKGQMNNHLSLADSEPPLSAQDSARHPTRQSPSHHRGTPHGSPTHKPTNGAENGPMSSSGKHLANGSPSRKVREMQTPSDEMVNQRMIMLELRMEEATKTIQVERDEKELLSQQIERLQKELSVIRNQHDEVRDAKQQVVKELNQMRAEHQRELVRVTSDLDDELNCRSTMDMRISDMRKELERLQAENAMEWGKRERLETEKLSLERDNKKLKAEIIDLKEHLAKKNKQVAADLQMNLKTLEENMLEKHKELGELKHNQGKLKKLLQEKVAELDHTLRRAEQHEVEVKKLRGRVDELKRELAKAEDEVDQQTNLVRKLQRNLEENQQSNENMAVQVEHLQARLRSMPTTTSTLAKKRAASFSFSSGNLALQDTRDEVTSDIDI
ncbi:coiled-coil domain-containing protein 102A-like [Patiria miniata]|uniref:Coiled-coil domain-containing protein 102A n=1 Tax=Patiria miniata TaxID=46514 RepID=A0A914B146_PATMI|nr:coiled-coil domain-containing protein 102A-like [Patiria miniata]XP_038070099.1 coiled-coil domain-containing protein 102A-like [Patiria miniata]XP_038070100.1 coiled-coil domain-containing protein 102A-like [Patiria miniata]